MIEYQYNIIGFCVSEEETTKWLENVIFLEKSILGEVGYVFCDDKFLFEINQRFLKHDTFTDIITFNSSEDTEIISGEIYISVERVRENAIRQKVGFDMELYRVIVHGILHLLGYKDKEPGDKLVMRQKEDHYLSLLF